MLRPWINHKIDLGFVFSVKCGSSTLRHWGRQNGFEPTPPHTARKLIGIVRDPYARFVSMIQQGMKPYTKTTFDEDPEVFDRVWPGLVEFFAKGKLESWYGKNPHYVKQITVLETFPPTEYWKLDDLTPNLQVIIDKYNFTPMAVKKTGHPAITQRIKDNITPEMIDAIPRLYPEDLALYKRV